LLAEQPTEASVTELCREVIDPEPGVHIVISDGSAAWPSRRAARPAS
jgi:hypothetical protein